jgi:hypothetical protein
MRAMGLMVQQGGCRVFLKPGQGKTASVLKAFTILKSKGLVDRLLVVAPLRVIGTSWPQEIGRWADFDYLTYVTIHGGPDARRAAMATKADIYLMNVEGLIGKEWGPINKNKDKRHANGNLLRPHLVPNPVATAWLEEASTMLVVDECFRGDAPVSTPSGPVRIDRLSVGQMVNTPHGPKPILAVFKYPRSKSLVSVNGAVSTEDHLYATTEGWVAAKDLRALQHRVYTEKEDHSVLQSFLREAGDVGQPCTPVHEAASVGNYGSPGGEDGDFLEQRNTTSGIYEDAAISICKESGEGVRERQVLEWKWGSHAPSGGGTSEALAERVRVWVCSRVERVWGWLPDKLQNRLGGLDKKDSNRGAGVLPQEPNEGRAGQEEEGCSGTVGVDSAVYREQGSVEWVWDIEVADCHCYFVNGLLVHNSTKFKDSQAARSKSLKLYLPHFDRRVILTGTPRPGKLEDLFMQCFITDDGRDLGTFVTNFRGRYMMRDFSGFGWVEQPGAAERVAAKIAPTTIQIEAKEVVPMQTTNVWVPLPETVREQYSQIKRELLTIIENKEVMAPNAGVLYGKLRQIAQGAIFHEAGGWVNVHDAKLDALENLLEELNGEPAFCLYQYSHDYERINTRLGYEVPRIGGGVSSAAGAAICQAFSNGAFPLLLGHEASVAHGIDGLQNNCRNVIWFGPTPSWEAYYQANLRIARPGTTADQVNIYHILADCGVERAVLAKAQDKELSERNFLTLLRNSL